MISINTNFENSNFYHVMNRGIAKQIIFEESSDNEVYLEMLKEYSEKHNIVIICYCLMLNHSHMICQDPNNKISDFMRDFNSTYAKYFNKKYDRVGTLFQAPFLKKPITNESYLMQAFHYVLKNPENDNICPYAEYKWSSYAKFYNKDYFVDTSIIRGILGYQKLDNFLNDDTITNIATNDFESQCERITDYKAVELIKEQYHIKTASVIRTFSKEKRDEAISFLRKSGLSIRQIERLTGVSKGIAQRIL